MIPRKYVSRTYTLAAGERKTISVVSNWFVVLASSAEFQVGIEQEDPEWITAGIAINTAGYGQIVLYNPGAAANVVQVAFSRQEVRDSRLTVSGVVLTKEVTGDQFKALATVTAANAATTALMAADETRIEAVLTNMGTGTIFLCDGAAASAIGIPLAAGETRALKTGAAIYARNESGAGVDIALAEIKRS